MTAAGEQIDWKRSQRQGADAKSLDLFTDGKLDAFLSFPPEAQELRSRKVTADAELWNQSINAELKGLLAAGKIDEARAYLIGYLGVGDQLGAQPA